LAPSLRAKQIRTVPVCVFSEEAKWDASATIAEIAEIRMWFTFSPFPRFISRVSLTCFLRNGARDQVALRIDLPRCSSIFERL
jgi:hypothetical protein